MRLPKKALERNCVSGAQMETGHTESKAQRATAKEMAIVMVEKNVI
jgi:hypothetical protein